MIIHVIGNHSVGKTAFVHELCALLENATEYYEGVRGVLSHDVTVHRMSFAQAVQFVLHHERERRDLSARGRIVICEKHYLFNPYTLGPLPRTWTNVERESMSFLLRDMREVPDLIIYLRASPDVSFDRMLHRRSRKMYLCTLSQLSIMHTHLEQFWNANNGSFKVLLHKKYASVCYGTPHNVPSHLLPPPVLCIDVTTPFARNAFVTKYCVLPQLKYLCPLLEFVHEHPKEEFRAINTDE